MVHCIDARCTLCPQILDKGLVVVVVVMLVVEVFRETASCRGSKIRSGPDANNPVPQNSRAKSNEP